MAGPPTARPKSERHYPSQHLCTALPSESRCSRTQLLHFDDYQCWTPCLWRYANPSKVCRVWDRTIDSSNLPYFLRQLPTEPPGMYSSEDCLFLNIYSPSTRQAYLLYLFGYMAEATEQAMGERTWVRSSTPITTISSPSPFNTTWAFGFFSSDEVFWNGVVNADLLINTLRCYGYSHSSVLSEVMHLKSQLQENLLVVVVLCFKVWHMVEAWVTDSSSIPLLHRRIYQCSMGIKIG